MGARTASVETYVCLQQLVLRHVCDCNSYYCFNNSSLISFVGYYHMICYAIVVDMIVIAMSARTVNVQHICRCSNSSLDTCATAIHIIVVTRVVWYHLLVIVIWGRLSVFDCNQLAREQRALLHIKPASFPADSVAWSPLLIVIEQWDYVPVCPFFFFITCRCSCCW